MSQSIRIGSGLGPILQHIPNASSSSCMFLSTEHTDVGFPINLSLAVKECRKRAAWISVVVSKRNPRLPCAATMKKSNVDVDGTSSSKGKYDDPLEVWRTILSKIRSVFCPEQVNKGVVVMMILRDLHDPIDGLKVLLDVSRAWRMILSLSCDALYDDKGFDNYGESYLRKARMKGGTNKGKHNMAKNPPSRINTRLSILRLLANLNDPNDGLEVLLGALEVWRMLFFSEELNDSEGYLQKEMFAIRDLSQRSRILVSNCNGIHDEAKNPLLQITHVLELLKLMINNFKDPSDAGETMLEAFRYCDETSGSLVSVVAKLNFDDNDGYLLKDIFAIPDSS